MSKLKNLIEKARRYYFEEWRGNEKICPAFNEKVFVTRVGWDHIVHHPRRILADKLIRLKRLSVAREILETATTYQSVEKRGKYFLYELSAVKKGVVTKVIVSSKGQKGKKIFFSVMFKRKKKIK